MTTFNLFTLIIMIAYGVYLFFPKRKGLKHQEALNKILSCACPEFLEPEEIVKANGVREYWITLHCDKLLIKAKPLPNNFFEIISIQKGCEIK